MFSQLRVHTPKGLVILAAIEGAIFVVSFYIGLYFSWVDFAGRPAEIVESLPNAAFYAAVLLTAIYSMGAYHRHYVFRRAEVFTRMLVGFLLAFAVLTALFYTLPILAIWRSVLIIAMAASVVGVTLVRYFSPYLIDLNLLKRRIVVLGIGEKAARIERLQQSDDTMDFVCLGYFDLGGEEAQIPRARILPQVNSLADFVKERNVDEVVIAAADLRRTLPMRPLVDCRLSGVSITDYLSFYGGETGRIDLDFTPPSWFLFSEGFRGSQSYRQLKRLLDILASLALLALSLPLILLTALAIAVERRGPILHHQVRVGLRGEPFVIWKFRSMIEDAEADGQPRWAEADDSRVTRIGAFLRRSRIDEIPQLFNILKGDMSIVGPRPERPQFVEQHGESLLYYADRHSVKPGLTGWAQLNYSYGASEEDARMKLQYDLFYVKYCGFVLDLLIMLQTLRVIFWPVGVR